MITDMEANQLLAEMGMEQRRTPKVLTRVELTKDAICLVSIPQEAVEGGFTSCDLQGPCRGRGGNSGVFDARVWITGAFLFLMPELRRCTI